METAYLNAFLVVVDTGSLAQAARRLNVTPAAIAQQVHVLERELGTSLLGRAGRTVAPTESGVRLAERARSLLRDFNHLRDWVNEAEAPRELRLGTINTALHSLLPETLSGFAAEHPGVSVFIQSDKSAALYDAVKNAELDAAVCLHPPFALPKTIVWELLREEPLVVLAPARLARRDPHELLRTEPLIRYDRSVGGGKQADRYLRQAGITAHERFELSSLVAIAMMVDRGLGVSLAPDIASPLTAGLRIAKLKLPEATEPRRFGILWQRASTRTPLILSLLRHARQAAG
ncbi:LysR family transcriptional regulator [Cupriavidus basilensis OR16]|uniref:LysR family transcriptional regulator n=1 Tax=Cupriavidus basilensis OR16 TaxID=1127483 RepID=H1S0W5_9BURK|nr:LysR substrate-binding domain-containing protein [Cupriavidus basilensis]EHP43781.1 LysR family transcriptional regulator [Cupriavidus basilensis OR16]